MNDLEKIKLNPLESFSKLAEGKENLVDWFGIFIVTITVIGIFYLAYKFGGAWRLVKACRKKQGNLYEQFERQFIDVNEASNEIPSRYRTTDPSDIFNTQTLGKGAIGNPLFIAIPAILTGLGVLGTFLGLQLGIGSLNFNSQDTKDESTQTAPILADDYKEAWPIKKVTIKDEVQDGEDLDDEAIEKKNIEKKAADAKQRIDKAKDSLVMQMLDAKSSETDSDGMLTEQGQLNSAILAKAKAEKIMETKMIAFKTDIDAMVRGGLIDQIDGDNRIEQYRKDLINYFNTERKTRANTEANFSRLTKGMDNIKTDVVSLLSGSSAAFTTSIWGISASLIFLLVERLLSLRLLLSIRRLQEAFLNDPPLYIPERSMIDLVQSSKESEEILKGLAVAIGEQMQEAIKSIGGSIKDAVQSATQSGAEELGLISAELLSKALTDELKNLKDTMEGIAEKFKGDFDRANEGVANVVGSLGDVLDGLKGSVDDSGQVVKDAVKRIEGQADILQSMRDSAGMLNEAAEKLRDMRNTFDESSQRNKEAADSQNRASTINLEVADKFNNISELLPEMSQQITEAAEIIASLGQPLLELNSVLEKFPEEIKEIDANREQTDQNSATKIIGMTDQLVQNVSEAAEKFTEVSSLTESLSSSAESLERASGRLSEFGSTLDLATERQGDAAKASERAASAGERAAEKLEPVPESIETAMNILGNAGDGMIAGADAVKDSLYEAKEFQEVWFDGVKVGMDSLRDSLQSLIESYGEKVENETRERFNRWAEALQESYGKFETLTQTLGGQIEELIESQDDS